MPHNVGTLSDLIEVYAGQAGVNRSKINRRLIWDLINIKVKEFARRTGIQTSKATIETVADQAEYELGSDVGQVLYVDFDECRINKITHDTVRLLQGNVS